MNNIKAIEAALAEALNARQPRRGNANKYNQWTYCVQGVAGVLARFDGEFDENQFLAQCEVSKLARIGTHGRAR